MTKDRLADLIANHRESKDDDNDQVSINMTSGVGGPMPVQSLLAEAEDVQQMINSIKANVKEVKIMHSDILSAPHTDEKLKMKLEDLTADISKTANKVRTKLKLMEPNAEQYEETPLPANLRIRKTQHSTLTRMFVDTMFEYNRVQTEHRDRCKGRLQRQLEITGRTMSNEELEELLEQDNPAVFTQGIVMETQQARQTLADIEARHADILKLENSIRELHAMFVDMAVLVESQGDMVDNIEYHVTKTAEFVDEGKKDLKEGKKFQIKSRRKKMYIALCLLVVAVIIVVAVVC